MKHFMQLVVTTDTVLTPTSRRTVLNFPCTNLTNILFDLRLVTEVDGYRNLKVFVLEQNGFEGTNLVRQYLNFSDLEDWNELADQYHNSDVCFTAESYMKFMGMHVSDFLCEAHLPDIEVIPQNDEHQLHYYLSTYLEDFLSTKIRCAFRFINWDEVLKSVMASGYGILYKNHYVFLKTKCFGSVNPLPHRLNEAIREFLCDNPCASNDIICSMPYMTFAELLHQLENREPLVPAFLDNGLRTQVFKKLADLVGTHSTSYLVELYEKIWVKPTKED